MTTFFDRFFTTFFDNDFWPRFFLLHKVLYARSPHKPLRQISIDKIRFQLSKLEKYLESKNEKLPSGAIDQEPLSIYCHPKSPLPPLFHEYSTFFIKETQHLLTTSKTIKLPMGLRKHPNTNSRYSLFHEDSTFFIKETQHLLITSKYIKLPVGVGKDHLFWFIRSSQNSESKLIKKYRFFSHSLWLKYNIQVASTPPHPHFK